MLSILNDLLIIGIFVLLLYGAEKQQIPQTYNRDYLSVSTGKALRGFFAIAVILHHLSQRMWTGTLFPAFQLIGYLAVSIFFFLSGYGMQKAYMKSENYCHHFLRRRVPMVLFPYIVTTLIYKGMYALDGIHYSIMDILHELFKGTPIDSFSWYIIAILLFYLAYKIIMLTCKKNYRGMITGSLIFNLVYIALCMTLHYGRWWYNTIHMLTIGIAWAIYEPMLLEYILPRYRRLRLSAWLLFTLFFSLNLLFGMVFYNYFLELITCIIAGIFFTMGMVLFTLRVKIGNPILHTLGDMSLELYLVQGLFIFGLRGVHIHMMPDPLWCYVTVFGSIALAYLLHRIFHAVLQKYRQYV